MVVYDNKLSEASMLKLKFQFVNPSLFNLSDSITNISECDLFLLRNIFKLLSFATSLNFLNDLG